MTEQPRDANGRWSRLRLVQPSVDDVCAGSWEDPPAFATQEDMVEFFLQQDVPDWAIRNMASEYNKKWLDVVGRLVDRDTRKEMERWDIDHPESSFSNHQAWARARLDHSTSAHANIEERFRKERPTSIPLPTARMLALVMKIYGTSSSQFPGHEKELYDLPVSTNEGDTRFGSFLVKWGGGLDPRCVSDPAFAVTQATEEAEAKVSQAAQRSIDQIIAETRERIAQLHDTDRVAEAEQRASEAERRADQAERDSDSRANRSRVGGVVGAVIGSLWS